MMMMPIVLNPTIEEEQWEVMNQVNLVNIKMLLIINILIHDTLKIQI